MVLYNSWSRSILPGTCAAQNVALDGRVTLGKRTVIGALLHISSVTAERIITLHAPPRTERSPCGLVAAGKAHASVHLARTTACKPAEVSITGAHGEAMQIHLCVVAQQGGTCRLSKIALGQHDPLITNSGHAAGHERRVHVQIKQIEDMW
jgi:hypothetical protein